MLTGLLELDGVAMTRRRVLLISDDMTRLLESAITDDNGVFRFALNDPSQSRVVVVAKIQEPVLSISYRIIDLAIHGPGPHRISIDSTTDLFHTLRAQITLEGAKPPYVMVHVDPVRLIGIPGPLDKFFRTVDENVDESWFSQFRVEGESFAIRVQNGTYRLDAQYFTKREDGPGNYSLRQAVADSEEPVSFKAPFESVTLNVDRDREVELTVGPID